jgi:hypothetical protein
MTNNQVLWWASRMYPSTLKLQCVIADLFRKGWLVMVSVLSFAPSTKASKKEITLVGCFVSTLASSFVLTKTVEKYPSMAAHQYCIIPNILGFQVRENKYNLDWSLFAVLAMPGNYYVCNGIAASG